MTNILKPKNPNPNVLLTYNNVLSKKTWFPWMPCLKNMIEKAFKLIWWTRLSNVTVQAVPKGCAAVTKTVFHVVSSWKGDNKFVYRVPQRIVCFF